MTLSSSTNRVDYTGTGTTDTYSYTFKIFNESHLLVTTEVGDVETTLTLNVDYTVTGVGEETGGTIVLTAGNLASGTDITIRRVLPVTQTTDISNQGPYFAKTHEDTFDIGRMIDQQLNNDISGSLKLPETISPDDVDTTLPAPSAGTAIGWNASGTGITNLTSIGTATLPGSAGLVAFSSGTTYTNRTLEVGDGLNVANANGLAGNPKVYLGASGTSGFYAVQASGAGVRRTITAGDQIAVADGTGSGGNPTISVDLDADGFLCRDGAGDNVHRTISSGTGITITNGNGVSGNPTISVNTSFTYQTFCIVKSSDETISNSTASAADAELKFTMAANETFQFEGAIFVTCSDNDPDIRVSFNGPAGVDHFRAFVVARQHDADEDAVLTQPGQFTSFAGYTAVNWASTPSSTPLYFKGTITNGATPGDFEFQWANRTANPGKYTTVERGSYIKYTKIP